MACLTDKNWELVEGWGFTAIDDYFILGPTDYDFDGYIVVSFDHTDLHEPHIWHSYDPELLGLQPLLTAGENITIENNVISATRGDRNIITAILSSTYNMTGTTNEILPYDTSIGVGNGLTFLNDGTVEVGAGIKKVMVSANVRFLGLVSSSHNYQAFYIDIIRSGVIAKVICCAANDWGDLTTSSITSDISCANCLADVQEGDIIATRLGSTVWEIDGESNKAISYMTVEAVEYDEPTPPTPTTHYTATFTPGDGTGTSFTVTTESGIWGESLTVPACTFTAPEGKVFDHWLAPGSVELQPGETHVLYDDQTITAIYKDEEEDEMRKLTEVLVISDGTSPTLTEGFYYTGVYGVYHNSALANNLLFGTGEILYFDADTNTLSGSLKSVFYEQGEWLIMENAAITDEVIDSREKIPTSSAVYDAINN